MPYGFAQLVELAGADEASATDVFLEVPESDWKDMFEILAVGPNPVTAMQRAAVIKHLKSIYEAHGCAPQPWVVSGVFPSPSGVQGQPPAVPEPPSQPQRSPAKWSVLVRW